MVPHWHQPDGRFHSVFCLWDKLYLKTVCDYVHLNPVRANLLGSQDRLLSYPWSSLVWYVAAKEHRPAWMRVDRLLGEHGIQEDTAAGRQEFERRMEDRRMQEEDEEQLKPLRRGWCLGSPEFRQRMLEQLEQSPGESHSAEVRRESATAKAERIVAQELARLGWKEEDLVRQRKNAPEKLAIAARLRKETILPIKSIAAHVGLGTSKGANRNLHSRMQNAENKDVQRKTGNV